MKLFLTTLAFCIFLVVSANAQCLVDSVVINTGYDPVTGMAISPGATGGTEIKDPKWKISAVSPSVAPAIVAIGIPGLVGVPPGSNADIVTLGTGWVDPTPIACGWINCINGLGYYTDGTGPSGTQYTMTVSRSFRMCSADSITIDMNVACDNSIPSITTDLTSLSFSQPTSKSVSNYSGFTHFSQTIFLTAGTHTINVVVNNYNETYPEGNPTGLCIHGTLRSLNGNALVSEALTSCSSFTCTSVTLDTTITQRDTAICINYMPLTLQAHTGCSTYLWSNGLKTQNISISASGKYWVTATDAAGNTFIDTILVTTNALPVITMPAKATLCKGDTLLIAPNVTSGSSLLWSTGATSSSLSISKPGTYSVTATNNGCVTSANITINEVSTFIDLGNDTTICGGDILILPVNKSDGTLHWSDGSAADNLTPTKTGTYWCSIKTECGTRSDTVNITIDPCEVWVAGAFTPNSDGRNDVFRVFGALSDVKDFTLRIFNRWGQVVFYTTDPTSGWDGSFNGIPQDMNTYVYEVIYSIKGGKHLLKGDLQLIR